MLRLPTARLLDLRFPSIQGYLLDSSFFRSPRASGVPPAAPGRWSTGLAAPLPVLSLLEEACRISQVPRVPFRAFALLLDPGRISTPSLFAALRFCPRGQDDEGSSIDHYFEAQSHGFRTAPYASCRHR